MRKSSSTSRKAPPRKRQFTGLVPTYRGFAPLQFQRGEWKYLDTTITFPVNDAGTVTLLNGMAPGTSATTRVGMNISIKSLECRFNIQPDLAAGSNQVLRFIALLDRQPNGALPSSIADFITPAASYGLRTLANRKRFKILMDKTYSLPALEQERSVMQKHWYMKFKRPINVEYNTGVAGTIADISTNALYFVGISTLPSGNTDGDCQGVARLRFTDM